MIRSSKGSNAASQAMVANQGPSFSTFENFNSISCC
uniref:Uncharacterized protein n=1 Tax=Physcomitrium patens TaxID=3218 RepID=A0A2K1KVX0_PHYPA|nr:hypothetical protein PHYPA_004913 [Physcomitrium patens]